MFSKDEYAPLIGATVTGICMSEDELIFQTDRGLIGYQVQGDCCSHSYFFDFYGVENLLKNGPVTAFEEVELGPGDPGFHDCDKHDRMEWSEDNDWHESRQVYGYRITTEHPTFGPVTSVFSFRNDSNGYYGGWMEPFEATKIGPEHELLTQDKVG